MRRALAILAMLFIAAIASASLYQFPRTCTQDYFSNHKIDAAILNDADMRVWMTCEDDFGTNLISYTCHSNDMIAAAAANQPAYSNAYGGFHEYGGVDDYWTSANDGRGIGNTNGTVAFWVKPTADANLRGILSISDLADTDSYMYFLLRTNLAWQTPDITVQFANVSNGTVFLNCASVSNFPAGEWHHFAFTSGTTNNRMYFDGYPCGADYDTGSAATPDYGGWGKTMFDSVTIGANEILTGPRRFFKGGLTDVMTWPTALTDAQILDIYERTKQARGF